MSAAFDVQDLRGWYRKLRASGVAPAWLGELLGYLVAAVRDAQAAADRAECRSVEAGRDVLAARALRDEARALAAAAEDARSQCVQLLEQTRAAAAAAQAQADAAWAAAEISQRLARDKDELDTFTEERERTRQ
jgi:hypothetical protein